MIKRQSFLVVLCFCVFLVCILAAGFYFSVFVSVFLPLDSFTGSVSLDSFTGGAGTPGPTMTSQMMAEIADEADSLKLKIDPSLSISDMVDAISTFLGLYFGLVEGPHRVDGGL